MKVPLEKKHYAMFLKIAQATVQILESKTDELQNIRWSIGEANTDVDYSNLACRCAEEAWERVKAKFPDYSTTLLKASSPDIHLNFINNGTTVLEGKIELKSRTTSIVLGSTIKGLDINQPVIYCMRNVKKGTFEFRYAQYFMCMGKTSTDLFQDRTPRPDVNFTKMYTSAQDVECEEKEKENWIQYYVDCALYRINTPNTPVSWQDDLTRGIQKRSIEEFVRNTSIEEFTQLKSRS